MYGSHPGKSGGQYAGPPELYAVEGGPGNLLKIVAAVPYRGDTIIVFDNTLCGLHEIAKIRKN